MPTHPKIALGSVEHLERNSHRRILGVLEAFDGLGAVCYIRTFNRWKTHNGSLFHWVPANVAETIR